MQWWRCGLLLEMPHGFLLMRSPSPLSSPSPPPSTTPSSTCCVSPTFANVSTKTHPRFARGSIEGVRSLAPENALEARHSATRTWASPTDSMTATARACIVLRTLSWVMWPPVKGPRASWQGPPSQRWRSVNFQLHQLIYFSDLVASVSAYFLFHNPAFRRIQKWAQSVPAAVRVNQAKMWHFRAGRQQRAVVCLLFSKCSALSFLMCFCGIAEKNIYLLPVDVIRFLNNHLEKKNKGIRQWHIDSFSP